MISTVPSARSWARPSTRRNLPVWLRVEISRETASAGKGEPSRRRSGLRGKFWGEASGGGPGGGGPLGLAGPGLPGVLKVMAGTGGPSKGSSRGWGALGAGEGAGAGWGADGGDWGAEGGGWGW